MTDVMKVTPGDFLAETLVTDTRVYEVVGRTAKTLKLRSTKGGETLRRENRDGNPYPVIYTAALPDPQGTVMTVRLRKDGTYRTAGWANPLRPATTIDGKPATYTDYRM